MAEEKKTERLERNYIIPLRKHWRKAPVYKRSKRAINALKKFLVKHMKSEDIKIGKELNELIFSRGFKNPPNKVQITAIKEENVVKTNLIGIPYKEVKKEEKKSVAEKLKEKVGLKKKIEKPGEIKEEKKTEVKKPEKVKEEKPKKEVKPEKLEVKKSEKPKEAKKEKTEKPKKELKKKIGKEKTKKT